MSSNFYDKECKHPIECFYDPCYRTGDFYKICYLNRNTFQSEKFDSEDTLFAVVNRSEGKPIYFVDSLGNELKLRPIKIEKYLTTGNYVFYFEDIGKDDVIILTYDENASLYTISEDTKDYGMYLSSYSFVPNYKEKDNVINPNSYKDAEPWSEEEKEIVHIRSTIDPYYKIEEYGK